MNTTTIAKPCTEVTLIRPEGSSQTFTLPEGATLADLFREAGAAVRGPNLLIDGRPVEEVLVLKSGMTIMIAPEPPQTPEKKDWRRTVGIFANDPTFEEAVAAGRAFREADRKATLEQMDAEQEAS